MFKLIAKWLLKDYLIELNENNKKMYHDLCNTKSELKSCERELKSFESKYESLKREFENYKINDHYNMKFKDIDKSIIAFLKEYKPISIERKEFSTVLLFADKITREYNITVEMHNKLCKEFGSDYILLEKKKVR